MSNVPTFPLHNIPGSQGQTITPRGSLPPSPLLNKKRKKKEISEKAAAALAPQPSLFSAPKSDDLHKKGEEKGPKRRKEGGRELQGLMRGISYHTPRP